MIGIAATAYAQQPMRCDAGEFCAWAKENYRGAISKLDLETANPGECVALPNDLVARSFANRLTREVTVYQGTTCSTEADFTTYPAGTYVPVVQFVARAIRIYEPT